MMLFMLTRRGRRGRLWQYHPAVLLQSTTLWSMLHEILITPYVAATALGSGTTTKCVAPTFAAVACGRKLQHLLQLWSYWPLCPKLSYTKAEPYVSPPGTCQPPTSWSTEGCYCQTWSCELHHSWGYSHGGTSSRMYIFPEQIPNCHFIWLWCYSWLHQWKACIQKYQLIIEHTNTPYMISTPGGNIIT
jgi:hypothetical protein